MSLYEKFQQNSFGNYHGYEPWDLVAPFYDIFQPLALKLLRGLGETSYKQFAVKMINTLQLPHNCRMLDAACGSGYLHDAIAEQLQDDDSCLAVDFSPGMLARAQKKAIKKNYYQFTFHRLSLYELTNHFPSNSFDGCTMSFTLPVLQQPEKIFMQFKALLKPDKKLVISTLSREYLVERRKIFLWRFLIRNYYSRYLSKIQLETLLLQAGFKNIVFLPIGWTYIISAEA